MQRTFNKHKNKMNEFTSTIIKNQHYVSLIAICFAILKGISFPIMKIVTVALARKLFFLALDQHELVQNDAKLKEQINQINNESLFDNDGNSSRVANVYFLSSFSIEETFVFLVGLAVVISIAISFYVAISGQYLNQMEVKRLQCIIYDDFILTPNSAKISQVADLLHSKIEIIKKYWTLVKFHQIDHLTTMMVCFSLFVILAWDLGLICIVLGVIIFIVSKAIWKKLSTPYAGDLEMKVKYNNAQLLDLVTCKELVWCHGQELQERKVLLDSICYSDTKEIHRLFVAQLVEEGFQAVAFTLTMPILFLYVYVIDLTVTRVFQLFIVIVVTDELMRCSLRYLECEPLREEFSRAKKEFCQVLNVDNEDDIFPPLFGDVSSNKKYDLVSSHHHGGQEDNSDKDWNDNSDSYTVSSFVHEKYKFIGNDIEQRSTPVVEQTSATAKTISDYEYQQDKREHIRSILTMRRNHPISSEGHNNNEIQFHNVSLGYTTNDNGVYCPLSNLCVSFKLGHRYALIGETGAGKSTIFKALSGLLAPLDGYVTVGGIKVDPTSRFWRQNIATITQDSVLLNRTLRENLCYSCNLVDDDDDNNHDKYNNMISDEEIMKALDKVELKDRIVQLPKGLDTMISKNGKEFSGGQQQRIQIARLLLSKAPIVLMDEFTSALDGQTTQHILQVLESFLADKTVILITHDVQALSLSEITYKVQPGQGFVPEQLINY